MSVLTRNITRERYFESTAQQERERLAVLAGGDGAGSPTRTLTSDTRFAKISALTLFLAAGVVTLVNSFVVHSRLIDVERAARDRNRHHAARRRRSTGCPGGCTRVRSGGS